MYKCVAAMLLYICGFLPQLAAAASEPAAVEESQWRLGVALGYGERSNPLINSDDFKIVVDLDIAWFGERFFFDNGDLGLTLADGSAATLNLIGRFNSDRVFFGKINSQFISLGVGAEPGAPLDIVTVPVPDRDYAFEVGVELLADGDWGYFQAAFHHDVSGVHDGHEVYANLGRGFRNQRWYIEPSIGISWKSANLNDYYWGVRDSEATILFDTYTADSGLNAHARVLASYQLNKHFALSVAAEFERLNAEAAASPIVDEDSVFAAFAGLSYRF